jgi:hypothetical protein
MAVHSSLNAFSFDISLIAIGQEIKLLEHLKKKLDHLYLQFVNMSDNKIHTIVSKINYSLEFDLLGK